MQTARPPHRQFNELVREIEDRFAVSEWRSNDIDLWPIASQDLFLDIFRRAGGITAAKQPPFLVRAATSFALPATNLWKSRRDLAHWLARPHRADSIILGDGVSLDLVDGAWSDRFVEPVASALERQGKTSFLMQSGNLARLPWTRATFAANELSARAALRAALTNPPAVDLPDHDAVIRFVDSVGIQAPSLARGRLGRRVNRVAAQAALFDRILRRVRPAKAFVVTYYAGLGHAFALACRRRGILCVDLQHCPHDERHRAYRWSKLPPHGYSTVPGLFWAWTETDASNIRRWSDTLKQPWHSAVAGGHPQIAAFAGRSGERLWQEAVKATGDGRKYDRDILVTLQPIGGKRKIWEAISEAISSSPAAWRWWIRRHPASTAFQDCEYRDLLSLGRHGVVTGKPAQVPLPILLSHMDAQVSLASGAASEAAMFGVPAFFLDDEARDTFPLLLQRNDAKIIDVEALLPSLARLAPRTGPRLVQIPDLERTLVEVDRIALEYSGLCAGTIDDEVDRGMRIGGQRQMPRA